MAQSKTQPQAPGTWSPLRHRVFLAIWLASIISSIGSQLQQVGAAWLMTSLAPSPEMVALVTALSTLPILLFSLPAGALADILDRRLVLLGAQILMLVASGVLAALAFAGLVTPALLLLLTFVVGSGQAIMAPAWQSTVGDLVPREKVPHAVGLNTMGFNIARTMGPALGGVLVAALGSRVNFALNAFSYLALIAVLMNWRPERRAAMDADSVFAAMRDGVTYTLHSAPVRRVILRAMCFGFCSSIVVALMALVARDLLHHGATVFGLLMGCMGMGAVIGAAQLGRLRNRFSSEVLIRMAIAVTSAALMGIGLSRFLPLTCLALFVVGAGMVLGLSTFNVSVQMNVPRWVSGRALALYQMFTFGGMTLGAWSWGHMAERVGIGPTYMICSVVLVSTLLLAWRLPVEEVHSSALTSAPQEDEKDLPEAPQGRGVSVVVVIEYVVPAAMLEDFLAAITVRQHIRMRDGARQVTLLQDATNAELWAERFQVRSWAEHLRQRQRRTLEAKEYDDFLSRCHRGPQPPLTRFYFEHRARPDSGERIVSYPLG
ncbi:MAG TPA: MFS transporter [Sphingomonadaceae bacterium]|nr:MFS transporter [Sphingomonadaceae bacterium]